MAVNKIQTKAAASILGLCLLWYIVSSTNNVIGKMLLNEFPYPMTVTMVQLTSITVYSGPFLRLWGVRPYTDLKNNYYFKIILPLAIGKFIASVFTHVSLWKVSVSYAHTVKATMPLFTVVLSRIILGETQTQKVYMSLVPIIVGVAIATLTEMSFDMVGLISTLVATCGLSLQNIFSKKVLHDTGMHHLRLLQILGRLALLMFLPVWLFFDFREVISHPSVASGDSYKVIILLLTDGCLNWLQNVLAFSVMSLVSPLTYAVASASKRLFVIGLSLIVLGNPVTIVNVLGMTMAVFGVLLYNKAKYDARQSERKQTILPMNKHSTPSSQGYMSLPSVPPNTDYFQRFTNSNVTLVRPHMAHTHVNGAANGNAANGWSRYGSPTLNSAALHKPVDPYNITSI